MKKKQKQKQKQKKKKKKKKATATPPSVRTARLFLCAVDDPRCDAASSSWCFSGGASGKVVLAERQVRLQSMLWAGQVDLAQHGGSVSSIGSSANSGMTPGSQALLRCSNSGSGHVSLVIDDRDTAVASGGVPAPRGAAFNWFVEPLLDVELVAKGLFSLAPNDAAAAAAAVQAQRERQQHQRQQQGKTKARKRSFLGRSPSKPLPSPPSMSSSAENDASPPNSSSSLQRRPVASSPPAPSPRSRRIARAAAASAGGRRRQGGQAFGQSQSSVSVDERPPFSPCSPFKARDAISRKGKELSVSVNDPYSALQDHRKAEDRARVAQRIGGEFMTAVPFATHNRYVKRSGQFLHSPDRRCVGMEQDFLKARAAQGLLKLEERARRSKKRWAKTHKARTELEARYG